MRKGIYFLLVCVLFLGLAGVAHAQNTAKLDSLIIQIWPEFDQPAALVIYDFRLASDTTLPAKVTFRIPKDVKFNAVAKDTGSGLVNVAYDAPTIAGDWQLITFSVEDLSTYRIEYYAQLERSGDKRSFHYIWAGDFAVANLSVQVQVPVGATDMQTSPKLASIAPGGDGFIYHSDTQTNLPAGQEYELDISYNKADDTLSATSINPQPSGGSLDQNIGGQSSFSSYLPWILGVVGIILIFGGVVWYWQTGKASNSSAPARSRRRRARAQSEDDDDDEEQEDGQIYCPQCGKRAQPSDRFCRACGTKIRRSAS